MPGAVLRVGQHGICRSGDFCFRAYAPRPRCPLFVGNVDLHVVFSLSLQEEAENDSILIANAKRLPQEVRANLPSGAPDPEAALPKPQEEGPKVIRMLESVVFGEKDEDEDGEL
jgi:hypothetical protein